MPIDSVQYPTAIDDDSSLFADPVDGLEFTLAASIGTGDLTITLNEATDLIAVPCIMRFYSGEVVYVSANNTGSKTLTIERADTPQSHDMGEAIRPTYSSSHFIQNKDTIIAIENELGTTPSGDWVDVAERLDALDQVGGTLVISSGVITISSSSSYIVDGQGSLPDDLVTISGMKDGQRVVISSANNSRIITLKASGGNIITPDGQDIILFDTKQTVELMRRGSYIYVIGGVYPKTKQYDFMLGNTSEYMATGYAIDDIAEKDMYVIGYTILSDNAVSVQIDLWADAFANGEPTDADSQIAGDEIKLVSQGSRRQNFATPFLISAGDWIRFNVDSTTNTRQVSISLKYQGL